MIGVNRFLLNLVTEASCCGERKGLSDRCWTHCLQQPLEAFSCDSPGCFLFAFSCPRSNRGSQGPDDIHLMWHLFLHGSDTQAECGVVLEVSPPPPCTSFHLFLLLPLPLLPHSPLPFLFSSPSLCPLLLSFTPPPIPFQAPLPSSSPPSSLLLPLPPSLPPSFPP